MHWKEYRGTHDKEKDFGDTAFSVNTAHATMRSAGSCDPSELFGPSPYRCPGQCREVAYLRIGESHLHEIAHLQLLLLDTPQPPGERLAERGV